MTAALRLNAFGLAIDVDQPFPGSRRRLQSDPSASLRLESTDASNLAPLLGDARILRYLKSFDNQPYAMLEGEAGDLLLVYGDRALFHLSPGFDVLRYSAATVGDADRSWERVLLDTVLWTTSLLQGFELLHMSAVETAIGVVAFAAASGGGKTSLAAEFLRSGDRLFSDDILAIDDGGAGVVAHPGPPVMNLPATLPLDQLADASALSDFGDERWVRVPGSRPTARPVAAIVLLERGRDQPLACQAVPSTTMTLLPYAVGFPHMTVRNRRRFELVGKLAAQTAVFRLFAAPRVSPSDLARLLATEIGISVG